MGKKARRVPATGGRAGSGAPTRRHGTGDGRTMRSAAARAESSISGIGLPLIGGRHLTFSASSSGELSDSTDLLAGKTSVEEPARPTLR